MSFTNVRDICKQNESYAFSQLFLFFVFPETNFRDTTIFLMKHNRERVLPMHFHDCFCRTYRGRAIPLKSKYCECSTHKSENKFCFVIPHPNEEVEQRSLIACCFNTLFWYIVSIGCFDNMFQCFVLVYCLNIVC